MAYDILKFSEHRQKRLRDETKIKASAAVIIMMSALVVAIISVMGEK